MYDYTDGKLDWMAAGLPIEGRNADRPRTGDVARRDVPTCRPDEDIREVHVRVSAAGWDECVVVNDERVVFGLLREEHFANATSGPVHAAMRSGPGTFRPHIPVDDMAGHMIEHELESVPITTSDGRLVGLLKLDDAARAAHDHLAAHDHDHEH